MKYKIKRILYRFLKGKIKVLSILFPIGEKVGVVSGFLNLLIKKNVHQIGPNKGNTKKIVFFRMRFVPRAYMFELSLVTNLIDLGAECSFFICSSILPNCNARDIRIIKEEEHEDVCNYCEFNNNIMDEILDIPFLRLKDFISKEEIEKAKSIAHNLNIDDIKNLNINNVFIGHEIEISIAKYLFRGKITDTPMHRKIAKEITMSAILIVFAIENYFKTSKPDIVIMIAGHILWYGIAYKFFSQNGVKVVTYDEVSMSVIKLHWILDNKNPVVDFNWVEQWQNRRTQPLTPFQKKSLHDLLEKRKEFFLYKEDKDTLDLSAEVNFENYDSVVTLFTNVLWDATVVGKNSIFSDIIEWVYETVSFFEQYSNTLLVVRVHPAEAEIFGMKSKEKVIPELKQIRSEYKTNIRFLDATDKYNSYELIKKSNLVLVYSSNIGLESLLMNKQVICAGLPHYRGLGLSIDPNSKEEYFQILGRFLQNEALPEIFDYELLERYSYLAYIDSQIDVNIFDQNHPYLVDSVKVDNLIDFKNNETLRNISKWLLNSQPEGIYFKTDWEAN